MIYLFTNTPKIYNDLADVVRLFYDNMPVKLGSEAENADAEIIITHTQQINKTKYIEKYTFLQSGKTSDYSYKYAYNQNSDDLLNARTAKRSAKLGLYYALKSITGKQLPWGALTGIRPVSLYRQLNTFENHSAHEQFASILDVSQTKLNLVEEIISYQENIYYKGESPEIDVYIGIPFCPTRCLYCSFISHDLSKRSAPIDEYVNCILKEIEMLKFLTEKYSKHIRCIYFGGGTPTTLSHVQMDAIFTALSKILDDKCEITVEAGRVDTIDDDKLKALKKHNVNRISINPQTFNDDTLKLVNRNHTSKDIFDMLNKVASYHFDSVNMDLIMGLPGETKAHMEHTLACIPNLPITNLTIHTLAIKRASKIRMNNYQLDYAPEETVAEMIEKARILASEMGMKPYYLYRQKYMSGNLENVGYAQKNMQCIYNIDIMEETHNLIAIGAGGISKRFYYDKNLHTRFANPKSVEHYIENIDKIIEDKKEYYKDF
ncbi:MAG: coproporphyrinogen dehydrogenase HemZ [Eubacteriales bacterium]